MGSTQSVEVAEEEESDDDAEEEREEEEEEEEDDDTSNNNINPTANNGNGMMTKKILEQEPEMLPCYASASPLSPQPSSVGTPRIKVWDPYNVLAPPSPPPPASSADVEVLLIPHGECVLDLTPDLVPGRCPHASLTPAGSRQARALAVFLNSQGVRFNAVYSSPLDRARSTAISVCQEMNFSEERIQVSDALSEMSQGQWEGCHRSEVYSPEVLRLMDSIQPDFSAPSGESLRQVELRMVNFLNATVVGVAEKLRLMSQESQMEVASGWERRKRPFGKSRLQFVSTDRTSSCVVGIFSHALPIKCLITGILGCSPLASHKLCIQDSSVTVLHHSLKSGWQIKKLNDTAHLRLL